MRIKIVDYNSDWTNRFRQERELLLEALGQVEASVEHIGSTAVPGLAAREIIDIMIGLRDFAQADDLVSKIITLDYTYVPEYEDVMPYRRFFRKIQNGRVTNHIHMVEVDKTFWQKHLSFRDYLRHNPEAVARYALLKRLFSALAKSV